MSRGCSDVIRIRKSVLSRGEKTNGLCRLISQIIIRDADMTRHPAEHNTLLSGVKVFKEPVDSENPGLRRIQHPKPRKITSRVIKDSKRGLWEIESTLQRKVDGKQLRSVYPYKRWQRAAESREDCRTPNPFLGLGRINVTKYRVGVREGMR